MATFMYLMLCPIAIWPAPACGIADLTSSMSTAIWFTPLKPTTKSKRFAVRRGRTTLNRKSGRFHSQIITEVG